jgi:hypothetical protein
MMMLVVMLLLINMAAWTNICAVQKKIRTSMESNFSGNMYFHVVDNIYWKSNDSILSTTWKSSDNVSAFQVSHLSCTLKMQLGLFTCDHDGTKLNGFQNSCPNWTAE